MEANSIRKFYYEIKGKQLILYQRKTIKPKEPADKGVLKYIGGALIEGKKEADNIKKCLEELIRFPEENRPKPMHYKAYQLIQNNIPIIKKE